MGMSKVVCRFGMLRPSTVPLLIESQTSNIFELVYTAAFEQTSAFEWLQRNGAK